MLQRMLGAARLDVRTFEEVEHDQNATFQAALVVIIVSVATGLGALGSREGGGIAFILGLVAGLLQWAVWAYITYLIGTSLFQTSGTRATWGQLARTTGFAQSPGVLNILGFIPVLGAVIAFVAFVWQLVAMVIAVRQALDYESTWRALGVVVVGFLVVIVIYVIFGRITAALAGASSNI